MADAERGEGIYRGLWQFARLRRDFIAEVLRIVRDTGPVTAGDIEIGKSGEPGWWGWSEAKAALEYLFWTGKITTLRRETAGFARTYDLTDRVLHYDTLGLPTPEPRDAQRELLRFAANVLGVATEADLREYFRLPIASVKPLLHDLVEAGEITPVEVEGWNKPAYLGANARIPRKCGGATLLSPFDPLVAERDRCHRLFGFHYRIEIYTPSHKRQYGYYCLPLLLGESLVARLDLKADRESRLLLVEAAHLEPGVRPDGVAEAAGPELDRMARWLGLEGWRAGDRGDLSVHLR
jgi:uncharacterized protein YcaQ